MGCTCADHLQPGRYTPRPRTTVARVIRLRRLSSRKTSDPSGVSRLFATRSFMSNTILWAVSAVAQAARHRFRPDSERPTRSRFHARFGRWVSPRFVRHPRRNPGVSSAGDLAPALDAKQAPGRHPDDRADDFVAGRAGGGVEVGDTQALATAGNQTALDLDRDSRGSRRIGAGTAPAKRLGEVAHPGGGGAGRCSVLVAVDQRRRPKQFRATPRRVGAREGVAGLLPTAGGWWDKCATNPAYSGAISLTRRSTELAF
jgi:hypothetical protein